ncbi:MAG: 50S ribosomal protein L32 [Sporolactobacillus sp.]
MAVPKRRTSTARKGKRRANQKLNVPTLSRDPETGSYHLSHRVSADGRYHGGKIMDREFNH